jgi:ATP-binding cassette, subfamily C, bacterial LapB
VSEAYWWSDAPGWDGKMIDLGKGGEAPLDGLSRTDRRSNAYVAVASVVLNVLALALPLALLQIYDRIIPNSSRGTLLLLVAGVATAVLLEAVLRVARSDIVGWIGIQFEHRAGCAAFSRIMASPAEELERTGAGELIERLSGLPMVREVFSEQWTLLVCDLPFVLLFLGAIAYVAGGLVLAPLVVLAVFVGLAALGTRRVSQAISDFNAVRDRRQNFSMEVVQGIHAVKSMAMEGQMIQRYARLQESVAAASHKVVLGNSRAMAVGQAFSQLLTLAVVVPGGMMVVHNSLTVGGLSACTLLAGRALQPVQKAVALWTRFQTARMMRRRFASVFELPEEARPAVTAAGGIRGAIAFEGVCFGRGEAGDEIFRGVDLHVRAGERVAIVGDNGSGKSTLLRLVLGSARPQAGRVLIDGVPVDEYDPAQLRQSIAYVPQRAELFRGTILENLTMFRPHLRAEALRIAEQLGLDNVVYHLPNGYDTRVGDGSSEALPRGVTQRIAMVRALAAAPRILLFDEANAAMDGPGDEQLRKFFETHDLGCTQILVTLRPSLQKLAGGVYEIRDRGLHPRLPPPPAPAAAPVLAQGAAE